MESILLRRYLWGKRKNSLNYLTINSENIPLKVEATRGKHLTIGFAKDELALILKIPGGRITPQVEAFLTQKQKWIWKHYSRLKDQHVKRRAFHERWKQGEGLYLGAWYPVEIYQANSFGVHFNSREIQLSVRGSQTASLDAQVWIKAYRLLAKSYLTPRTWQWAEKTDSQVKNIFIKNHKSKWGSCSSNRNINLNWHLIFLPESLVDYIIIHELMHLREMNHSAAYWQWVARFYPQYKAANKLINEYNWVIGIFE